MTQTRLSEIEERAGRAVKPRTDQRVAIVGPCGNLWSCDTYDTVEQAEAHLRQFWNGVETFDIGRWSYAPVSVTQELLSFPHHQVGPWPFAGERE